MPDIEAAIDMLRQEQLQSVTGVEMTRLCRCRVGGIAVLPRDTRQKGDGPVLAQPLGAIRGQPLGAGAQCQALLPGSAQTEQSESHQLMSWQDCGRGIVRALAERPIDGGLKKPRWRMRCNAISRSAWRRAWAKGFDGSILMLLSANDYTAKEFLEHAAVDQAWLAC